MSAVYRVSSIFSANDVLYALLRNLWSHPNTTNLIPSPSRANLQTTLSPPSVVVTCNAATATSTAAPAPAAEVTPKLDGMTVHCVLVDVVFKHRRISPPCARIRATGAQGTRHVNVRRHWSARVPHGMRKLQHCCNTVDGVRSLRAASAGGTRR